jgi:Tfp pilus assembly protein PilO
MAKPKSLSNNEKAMKLISVLVLLTLLSGLGVSYIGYGKVGEAAQELEKQRKALEEAKQAPHQLEMLQAEYERTIQELRYLERGVSEAAYMPTLLKQLEGMVGEVDLKIQAIRPVARPQKTPEEQKKENADSKPYEEQLIQVSVRGKFWSLMSFLKNLQAFPKILAVQKLTAQSKLDPAQTGNPDLEVQMEVKAFIFKQHENPEGQENGQSTAGIRQEKPEVGNRQ